MGKTKKTTKKFLKNRIQGEIKKRRLRQKIVARRGVRPLENKNKKLSSKSAREDDVSDRSSREGSEDGVDQQEVAQDVDFGQYLEKELHNLSDDDQGGDEGDQDDDHDDDDDDGDDDMDEEELEKQLEEMEKEDEERRKTLMQMAEKDPSFAKFLEENDPELLEDDDDDGEEKYEMEDYDDDDVEEEGEGKKKKKKKKLGVGSFYHAVRRVAGEGDNKKKKGKGKKEEEEEEEEVDDFNEEDDEEAIEWGLQVGLTLKKMTRSSSQKMCRAMQIMLEGPQVWSDMAVVALGEGGVGMDGWKTLARAGSKPLSKVVLALLKLWGDASGSAKRAGCLGAVRCGVLSLAHPLTMKIVRACHASLALAARVEGGASMKNMVRFRDLCEGLAEVCGLLDDAQQYHLIYGALRQHALHMRGKERPSWAILLSLRACALLIRRSLERHSDVLKPLLYPCIHLVLGTVQTRPTADWAPLHLLLFDVALLLAPFAYIPVSSAAVRTLSTILASHLSNKKPKVNILDDSTLNVSRSVWTARGMVRDVLVRRLVEIVQRDATIRSRHPAFPEWAITISRQLRYLCRYGERRQQQHMKQVAQLLDNNARHILKLRSQLGLTPKQSVEVATALMEDGKATPLETFAKQQEAAGVKVDDFMDARARELGPQLADDREGEEQQEEYYENDDDDDDDSNVEAAVNEIYDDDDEDDEDEDEDGGNNEDYDDDELEIEEFGSDGDNEEELQEEPSPPPKRKQNTKSKGNKSGSKRGRRK